MLVERPNCAAAIITRGSEKIAPADIDAVLLRHPAVAVAEAAFAIYSEQVKLLSE
jgi:non-ribosomal peptide synthetase component E (peptide arylation enzyme)